MKKLFVLLLSAIVSLSSFANIDHTISEKTLQSFQVTFPNAEQVNWTELSDTYVVNFIDNGIRSRVFYSKNAEFIGSIRYYSANHLPLQILIDLNNKFPGKSLAGVTEIAVNSMINYQVVMEDEKHWYNVRVDDDGFFTIVDKFRK